MILKYATSGKLCMTQLYFYFFYIATFGKFLPVSLEVKPGWMRLQRVTKRSIIVLHCLWNTVQDHTSSFDFGSSFFCAVCKRYTYYLIWLCTIRKWQNWISANSCQGERGQKAIFASMIFWSKFGVQFHCSAYLGLMKTVPGLIKLAMRSKNMMPPGL